MRGGSPMRGGKMQKPQPPVAPDITGFYVNELKKRFNDRVDILGILLDKIKYRPELAKKAWNEFNVNTTIDGVIERVDALEDYNKFGPEKLSKINTVLEHEMTL